MVDLVTQSSCCLPGGLFSQDCETSHNSTRASHVDNITTRQDTTTDECSTAASICWLDEVGRHDTYVDQVSDEGCMTTDTDPDNTKSERTQYTLYDLNFCTYLQRNKIAGPNAENPICCLHPNVKARFPRLFKNATTERVAGYCCKESGICDP